MDEPRERPEPDPGAFRGGTVREGAEPPIHRHWTDARDGVEWTVSFNPGVALDNEVVRTSRERIFFDGPDARYDAPAVFGSDLDALSDGDLQGLLDQAQKVAKADSAEAGWGKRLRETDDG